MEQPQPCLPDTLAAMPAVPSTPTFIVTPAQLWSQQQSFWRCSTATPTLALSVYTAEKAGSIHTSPHCLSLPLPGGTYQPPLPLLSRVTLSRTHLTYLAPSS